MGRLTERKLPGGPFTRIDSHASPSLLISPEYDSLIAKVVTWGETRERALARMDRALAEVRISGEGVRTTRDMLRRVLADAAFRQATTTRTSSPA